MINVIHARVVVASFLLLFVSVFSKNCCSQIPLKQAWASSEGTREVLQRLFIGDAAAAPERAVTFSTLPYDMVQQILLAGISAAPQRMPYREAAVFLVRFAGISSLCREIVIDFVKNIHSLWPQALEIEDRDGNLLMHAAVLAGCYLIVAELLNSGVDPSVATTQGFTPLHCAALQGNEMFVTLLVSSNANVNARTKYSDKTPAHFAANNNNAACMRILLSAGADPNAGDDKKWTPLHIAAIRGNDATVRALLSKPTTNVNATNCKLWTPLHCAAHRGFWRTITCLLQGGARKGDRNKYYERPVDLVNRARYPYLVQLLRE